MKPIKSKSARQSLFSRVAAGCLVAAGFALAAASPAMADGWGRGHHGHWGHDDDDGGYYYGGPQVVYVQPRPRVYYQPAPVYYAPQPVYVAPPPPVYYAPQPVYAPPSLNVVIPLRFH